MTTVTITNGVPDPNPLDVSIGQNTEVSFKNDDAVAYTLKNLNQVLDAPSSVSVGAGATVGPYFPVPSVGTGTYPYQINPAGLGSSGGYAAIMPEDPPEIVVNP